MKKKKELFLSSQSGCQGHTAQAFSLIRFVTLRSHLTYINFYFLIKKMKTKLLHGLII